jgi:Xaa-Pro aminopeptidase
VAAGISASSQIPPFGGQAALATDLAARRAAIMSTLGSDTVLVLWSAPRRVYSADTDYEYRQESNLLYLSGIDQPGTVLVLAPGGIKLRPGSPSPSSTVSVSNEATAAASAGDPSTELARELIFVSAVDPQRELWEGRVLRPAEVTAHSGIRHVYTQRRTEVFDEVMSALLADNPAITRLMILDRISDTSTPTSLGLVEPDAIARVTWASGMQAKRPGLRLASAEDILERARSIKTPYEQALLRRSVAISAQAHIAGMRATRPGRWEYEVEAEVEREWHRQGALSWGYPSIVASGPNATILHYLKSNRQMQSGDLLLVDAAGNYQGLTGDITRTYPVNGRFTRDQRALYDLVLQAADAGIAAAKPGGRVSDISRAVKAVLGPGLLKLGLVTDPAASTGDSSQIAWWAPHSPTHGIGIDVHDPLGALDPGAAFVVEPGLYIRPDVLDRLASAPETRALADSLRPVVERYLNIGIRIEDSFLMTPSGPENLSAAVPRTASEVEKVVGTGP